VTARRRGFAHLHVHTVHSTLDAMIQHEEMCDEVLADAEASGSEIAAIASTDHGTLSGLYKFSKMARRRGVTPLFGNEVYLANGLQEGARFAKDGLVVAADGAELDGDKADGGTGKRKTKRYEHMTLLAETEEGWRNLIRINNAAQAPDAKWGKPRADIDLLCRHSEGIIALTGCLGGPVLGSVARGDVDRARSVLNHMLNNGFDRDHVFLEIMEHGIPQEAKAMRTMLDLGDEFEIAPVATNDAHFAAEGDAHSHEAWLCNATKSKLADPDRWKFHGEGYWLRSASDMRAIFDGDERTQMACDNTLHIAERIAQSGDIMTPSELRLPEFPVPDGYAPSASAQRKGLTGSAAYLNDQIREGAVRRYGSPLPAEVRERLTYEFDVIHSMGLGDYFLIVQDLIAAARREGIRVGPGRGCLDGDSLIWTTDGYKKIRDIAIGDLVRTHTGAIRPVEMTFRYDVDEPLYTIRSYADGQGVSMTGDHKVLVRRCSTETDVRRLRSGATFDQGLGTGPEWVRSDSVSPGDLMCIPRPPSPGTGATVIDVAALLPQDTRGTLVTVTDDEIIEVVPSNKAFRGSIRDVSMRHGIARNVIKTALGPFREPKHAARRPGLLAKYEATVARLSAALASDGWNSTEEWDEYRQSRDRITVVTPRFIPADDNLLFLIGAFASNGWLRSDSIRSVGFAEQRSQSDDTIPLAVKRVWGIEATSHPHASTDLVQWDVRSLAVRALFRKLMPDYGMKAQTKHLPSFVDDLSIDQKRSLLDGLWWGDGSRSEHRWSYSTTSPELMRQVRDLLWAIGAPAGVTVDDRTDTRKGFENRTRAWKIRTTPGFAPHAAQFGGTDDNYVYSRVREVTGSLPVAEVFDFQVGTDHSFMTDSYVVHNSAAGCAISYCLDIVNIDPIRYNLLFERFLNPERIGMPDIDIDFESSGRDWAFGYLARRYGVDRVARIGSFGVALSKGAIRAAARVLSVPGVGDDLSAAVPTNKNGKPQTFAEFMDPQNPSGDEFRRRVAQSEDHQAVAELAESWEGGIDKEGVHSCGVIIGRDPLDGEVPLRESKGFWVSQWDGKDLDALQFLKLDALALRNLDVVTAAERLIEQTTGERIDADNPSLDPADPDPVVAERVRKTFELLQAGNTAGVFQLECVAGDTLVSGRKISEWFAKQEAGDPLRRTRSAYLNEGKWHFNDVIRIVKTGRSATRRLVTVTGRMIEATDGHMFMTENGWKRLDQIAVGENLLVDTRAKQLIHRTCIDCGARTNPDANNPSERCYSCSARHHSNPSSAAARSAISHAAKAGYEAGREPWNKGLDKEGSPILAENGRKIALANRGKTWEDIYGPTRAAEFRRETSVRMSGENNHMFGTTPPHTKQGYREDLGHFVRSTWEADYARVLVHFNEPYEYEKRRFDVVLPDGTRTTYTPDFYLPNRNQYVEIKGFMRDKDRVKIAAFLEQYPDIDFVLVDQVAFAEFEAANRHLVAWECPSVPKSACWEPVSQVLDAGEQDTYDIQMKAPAHNYLANGFVVHNSGGITELCVRVGPTTLDDVAAIVALYRPGPLEAKMEERYALRKNGLETVDYGIFSPDRNEQDEIAKVLDETFGVPIFQEQLMRLGDVVAGFGPIERNRLQKAVSKKLQDEMAAVGELFIAGAMAERRNDDGTLAKMAFRRDTAEKVWAAIKGAGNYAFNASHSYAYGWVTYITAFVKANWPTQYGAALLSVTKKADKRHEMLLSLAAEGIAVVAPRINEALVETTVNDAGEVVIGMVEVRDVSRDDAEAIVAARDAGGPFTSLADFAQRCLATGLETRVKIGAFEGLIEAGAFDELAPEGRTNRMGMVLIARALGQLPDLVPFDCEWSHLERARREAHRLGVLISPNPTKYLGPQIREASIGGIKASPLRKADEQRAGGEFTTAAIVSSWSEQSGHWGRRADVLLTGTGAAVRATIWDKTLHKLRAAGRIPEVGDLVLVKGKIVMRKARLENENGEMADGEAVADEKAEISVWEMQVVDVDGKHFDVPAGPPALHEHWFVRPDGFIDEPEPAPLAVEAPAAGELPFGDPDPVVTTEPVSEPQADPEPSVLAAAPDVATRPADRSVAAPASPFGELLEADPGVVELPWSEGEVDTIIVELAHGSLGASSSTSSALRIMRREVAAVVSAVVHLQRRPHSDGADIADEVRPLVDEMLAGRPVEVVAYDEPQPRSTWLVPADGEWGVAAQAWAEHLASPAPVVALAAPVADRTAA
jgi:DNA polymerase III alpha subunit